MKKILNTLVAFALVGIFAQAKSNDDTITLPTITGKSIHIKGTENGLDIEEYKGKVVFLEFWGTHCPPCLDSIPHYIDMINKFKGKLSMLGIEVQDTPKDQLKKFVSKYKMNYDVISYRDAGYFVKYIAQRADWKGSIPFLMILDQKGNMITMQVGLLPQNVLEKVVKDLLSNKPKKK